MLYTTLYDYVDPRHRARQYGLEKANLTVPLNRPGNIYLRFPSEADRNQSADKLSHPNFGENPTRKANDGCYLQVNNLNILQLLSIEQIAQSLFAMGELCSDQSGRLFIKTKGQAPQDQQQIKRTLLKALRACLQPNAVVDTTWPNYIEIQNETLKILLRQIHKEFSATAVSADSVKACNRR